MKPIKGFEGLYEIAEDGTVRRIRKEWRDAKNRIRIKQEVTLKPYLNNMGRQLVRLSKNGISSTFLVNRLVAINYIPNPNNHPVVMHLDNNPLNNNISNLQWNTQAANLQQMHKEKRWYRKS